MHLNIKILAYQNRIDIFIKNLINLSISNKKYYYDVISQVIQLLKMQIKREEFEYIFFFNDIKAAKYNKKNNSIIMTNLSY